MNETREANTAGATPADDRLGGSLELGAPVSDPHADGAFLARRRLDLEEGEVELRYRADPGRLGWIEVERKGAVALALTAVRTRLRDTQQRILAVLAELEGETHAPPLDREQRIHSLAAEVRRLPELLAEDAHALVAGSHPRATGDADGTP